MKSNSHKVKSPQNIASSNHQKDLASYNRLKDLYSKKSAASPSE